MKERVHDELQAIDDVPGLRGKQAQRLRTLIADRIVSATPERGQRGVQQAKDDMEKNPHCWGPRSPSLRGNISPLISTLARSWSA